MSDNDNNAAAIIEFARENNHAEIHVLSFEGADEQVIVTKDAEGGACVTTVCDLFSDRAAAPIRRKGSVEVHDVPSFVAAVNRDSNPASSVIFADVGNKRLTAILDYHNEGGDGGDGPRWGQDRITYGFTLSPALTAWLVASTNKDGTQRVLDQKTFARLIDDRLGDIDGTPDLDPSSLAAQFAYRRSIRFASIPDLVIFTKTLAARSVCDAKEIVDEATGDSSVQYTKKNDLSTNTGDPVTPPLAFVLRIPIFCGAEAKEYNIAVRLRFDVDNGAKWKVELHALDKYMLAAVSEAVEVVRGARENPNVVKGDAGSTIGTPAATEPFVPGCGLPVFMGVAPPL